MGRQIYVALSYEDEQNLVDQLRQDGFVVVPERLPSPRVWEHAWDTLPSDEEAQPWDYASAIVPLTLARSRPACFVGLASPTDTRPRGSIPSRLAYSVNSWCVPSIQWDRNRRVGPRTVRTPGGGGRLYVDTQRDYGEDETWKEAAIREYEKIIKLIKRWTVRRGKWGYWSKQLDPPPTDP